MPGNLSHVRPRAYDRPMSYPVTFQADYVEQRSRLTAFFRLLRSAGLPVR